MLNLNKGFAPVFVIVVVAVCLVLGGVLYYANVANGPGRTVCTEEAKQCPDGSSVGRTGPNCEFAECPAAPSEAFCGGIAGIACPEGYDCKLEGNYPDAGGRCVKSQSKTGVDPAGKYRVVMVRDVAGNPNTFLNEKVSITGKLIKTNPKPFPAEFAVTDGVNSFPVSAWLVLEAPPPMPGSPSGRPLTMQSYLGKTVTLEGVVLKDEIVFKGFYLNVNEVR